jgi:predicted AlkP superfamily phosphohydrolase/phosphomutase
MLNSARKREIYLNATWSSFQQLMHEAPAAWKVQSKDARHYRAEKDMINKHIEPVYWECSWGVSLATFRVSGSKWYARIGKRQPPTQEQQEQHFKTYLEKETSR